VVSVSVTVRVKARIIIDRTEIEFTVRGQRKRLSRADVTRKLKGRKLATIKTHAVEVGGVLYPVKEAFAVVTGLDLLDFNTNQARNVFRRLGFNVNRVS
jgi:hypothetical protein